MKVLRLLMLSIFLLAACEEEEPAAIAEEEVETPADSVQDSIPADTVPADTVATDTIPADTVAEDTTVTESFYYPSVDDSDWETTSAESLGWNADSLQQLLAFVQQKNTYGFMILYKGKIVTEKYWGEWNAGSRYPIASAGKTVTAFLIGIAQQEGLLDISKKTSDYLGAGWTQAPPEKENLITLRHQLSMTTGLDEVDDACNDPGCLNYRTDAGTRWAYHTPPYNLLNKILESVSGVSLDEYTKTRLADKIGLRSWAWESNILSLSTRDMARFGLLILSKGLWNGQQVMTDSEYFEQMISPSNNFNKSYGYLWWLNGKDSFMIPGDENVFQGSLVPSAPAGMFAAMGKGDKKIYVVPDHHLVIVRHGDDTGESTFGPSSFDSELWKKLQAVINK
jgi:CubicO group peptidase (beta-lactamase class C family)